MHARRRILFGVVALALPVTGFAVFGTPSMFAGASSPTFPVACKTDATLTISPPLTQGGTHTTNPAAATTVTVTGGHLGVCLSAASPGAPGHGVFPTFSYSIPATKLGKINGVKTYATGYCPTFASSSLKALKGLKLAITWTGGAGGASDFTAKKVTPATNTDLEVGFTLSGKEGLGSYAEKSLNQITWFIDATNSPILNSGCAGAQTVSSATFDNANSVAIL
jgi:hypothetical protein